MYTGLLNLYSVTMVHRFTSPGWLHVSQRDLETAANCPFPSEDHAIIKKHPNRFQTNQRIRTIELVTENGWSTP